MSLKKHPGEHRLMSKLGPHGLGKLPPQLLLPQKGLQGVSLDSQEGPLKAKQRSRQRWKLNGEVGRRRQRSQRMTQRNPRQL